MRDPQDYVGREQTYIKHFFLDRYLERVAFNLLARRDDFVFVDGFSGPWKSNNERREDTSIVIALNKFRMVRSHFARNGRQVRIKCFFLERDAGAFEELEVAIARFPEIETRAVHGEFERSIAEIRGFIGNAFSFVFVDPTGWTGFGLSAIAPILQLRGEVLVNFMFDEINRHLLEDPRPEIIKSFDPLFGGTGWNKEITDLIQRGWDREDAVVNVYCERFRRAGQFPYVTSTRILKPLSERTYFHLVYGTRHWKGLFEFRNVEEKAISEQERVSIAAKQTSRAQRTGQNELFLATDYAAPQRFDDSKRRQSTRARLLLEKILQDKRPIPYREILGKLLEIPLVWKSDIDGWLIEKRDGGMLEIRGFKSRERVPKPEHIVVPMT